MRRAGRAALLLVLVAAASCRESGELGESGEPDATPSPAPTALSDATLHGLELAVLPPMPEFVEPEERAPQPGHAVAHGTLAELAQQLAPHRSEALPPLLGWDALAAPSYAAPFVAGRVERPALEAVLAQSVLAARGARVAIDGFATVERERGGAATALVLTPLPPNCCLGRFPRADERVHASVPLELGLAIDPFVPVRLVGRFAAEERRDELGLFEGLYFLDVDAVSGAREER